MPLIFSYKSANIVISMATLELIRNKVDSAKDLQSVVKTMKGLADVGAAHL